MLHFVLVKVTFYDDWEKEEVFNFNILSKK